MPRFRLRNHYDDAGSVEAYQVSCDDLDRFYDWWFSGDIECLAGDWVVKQGDRFVVCDPVLFDQLYTPAEVEA